MTQPFQFANGQLAHNAEDLLELCQQFPVDGTNYLIREDIEKWLSYIGKNDIAKFAANARQAALDDRQKLEEFLNKCHALSSPSTESAVTETPAKQNLTVTATPVVETKEEQTPLGTESPVVETKAKEEQTPIAMTTPSAQTVSKPSTVVTKSTDTLTPSTNKTSEPSVSSTSTEDKPSFFKAIATLFLNILNIFNRGKD